MSTLLEAALRYAELGYRVFPCVPGGKAPLTPHGFQDASADAEQIEVWNGFLTKRGWRDSGSAGLVKQREEAGLGHREDLQTFFDMMDVEEGRAP